MAATTGGAIINLNRLVVGLTAIATTSSSSNRVAHQAFVTHHTIMTPPSEDNIQKAADLIKAADNLVRKHPDNDYDGGGGDCDDGRS